MSKPRPPKPRPPRNKAAVLRTMTDKQRGVAAALIATARVPATARAGLLRLLDQITVVYGIGDNLERKQAQPAQVTAEWALVEAASARLQKKLDQWLRNDPEYGAACDALSALNAASRRARAGLQTGKPGPKGQYGTATWRALFEMRKALALLVPDNDRTPKIVTDLAADLLESVGFKITGATRRLVAQVPV